MSLDHSGFDVMILTRTVWGEARGEPFRGQLAVAYVVLNRWRSGKWFAGKTIASTCLKARQFSTWDHNDPNREKLCDATLDDLAECRAAAIAALTGAQPDPTEGACHYHAVGIEPAWAAGKAPTITIGKHVYYGGIE